MPQTSIAYDSGKIQFNIGDINVVHTSEKLQQTVLEYVLSIIHIADITICKSDITALLRIETDELCPL